MVLLPTSAKGGGKQDQFPNLAILIVVILFFGGWQKSKNPLLHNIFL
jgi:hypothetical protein